MVIINQHANECVQVLKKADKFPFDLLTFFRQVTLDISFGKFFCKVVEFID
jgi:hypothetical protein